MKQRKNEKGQGLIEYILIVGVMGVLAIAAVHALGQRVTTAFQGAHTKLNTEFNSVGI